MDNARLDRFEDSVSRLHEVMSEVREDLSGMRGEVQSEIRTLNSHVNMHRVAIYGDGNGMRGLDKRVDRLEEDRKQKKWWLGAVVGAALASIGAWLANIATAWHAKP